MRNEHTVRLFMANWNAECSLVTTVWEDQACVGEGTEGIHQGVAWDGEF